MTEFTKDNLPELLRYLTDYMDKHPECVTGFGLEYKQGKGLWCHSESTLLQLISNIRSDYECRIKPVTRTVYGPDGVGVECPAPLSVKPSDGYVYFEGIDSLDLFRKTLASNMVNDFYLDSGICYATAEDAVANCRARYGIKEGE